MNQISMWLWQQETGEYDRNFVNFKIFFMCRYFLKWCKSIFWKKLVIGSFSQI